jgi:hypothetical protein
VLGVAVGGVGWTDITERTGKTLSAAAGLSTSSARNVGDFGGISTFMSSRGIGSPASVSSGLSTRAEEVPGAELPSFSRVEASACPLSSSEAPPAPPECLALSCSLDITAHSSDPSVMFLYKCQLTAVRRSKESVKQTSQSALRLPQYV